MNQYQDVIKQILKRVPDEHQTDVRLDLEILILTAEKQGIVEFLESMKK
jgi:hypothetical protein